MRAGTAEEGYLHCGPSGAGHFVKMVHNGIEYGLMAAYAEGLNILKHADVGRRSEKADAETTPLRGAEYYQYDFPLDDVTEVWRRGSVISSWLLDLTAAAFAGDPQLAKLRRPRLRLGRGALDARRGHRRRGPGARAGGVAVRAVQLARRGRVSEPDPLGDALRVRRPPGKERRQVDDESARCARARYQVSRTLVSSRQPFRGRSSRGCSRPEEPAWQRVAPGGRQRERRGGVPQRTDVELEPASGPPWP